ncbi:MAG: hypothetical protein IPK91_09975 [Saprospiraceae bacterium]|nr:hypothetical protein [Saprospiraceae bacterium]MBK8297584.1 hypothetical protein [Saprospiraceae bacterium]
MKKIIALLILIILILLFYCIKQRNQIVKLNESSEQAEMLASPKKLEFGQDKNFSDVSYENAKKLVKEYVRTNGKSNWYVYFKKDDLPGIAELINNSKEYGIKVYFGRYYDDDKLKEYIKVLFDNDPDKVKDFLDNYTMNTTAIFAQVKDENGTIDRTTLKNLGGLCPPRCKPTTDITMDDLVHK